MNEPIYERIANSSLSQHVGKPVTLLGEFDQLEPNGRMFTMKTSPNSTVTIQLQEPFVEASYSTAKTFIENIFIAAKHFHNLPEQSFTKNPFYTKESREAFRALLGKPELDDEIPVPVMGFVCSVYFEFTSAVCAILKKWLQDFDLSEEEKKKIDYTLFYWRPCSDWEEKNFYAGCFEKYLANYWKEELPKMLLTCNIHNIFNNHITERCCDYEKDMNVFHLLRDRPGVSSRFCIPYLKLLKPTVVSCGAHNNCRLKILHDDKCLEPYLCEGIPPCIVTCEVTSKRQNQSKEINEANPWKKLIVETFASKDANRRTVSTLVQSDGIQIETYLHEKEDAEGESKECVEEMADDFLCVHDAEFRNNYNQLKRKEQLKKRLRSKLNKRYYFDPKDYEDPEFCWGLYEQAQQAWICDMCEGNFKEVVHAKAKDVRHSGSFACVRRALTSVAVGTGDLVIGRVVIPSGLPCSQSNGNCSQSHEKRDSKIKSKKSKSKKKKGNAGNSTKSHSDSASISMTAISGDPISQIVDMKMKTDTKSTSIMHDSKCCDKHLGLNKSHSISSEIKTDVKSTTNELKSTSKLTTSVQTENSKTVSSSKEEIINSYKTDVISVSNCVSIVETSTSVVSKRMVKTSNNAAVDTEIAVSFEDTNKVNGTIESSAEDISEIDSVFPAVQDFVNDSEQCDEIEINDSLPPTTASNVITLLNSSDVDSQVNEKNREEFDSLERAKVMDVLIGSEALELTDDCGSPKLQDNFESPKDDGTVDEFLTLIGCLKKPVGKLAEEDSVSQELQAKEVVSAEKKVKLKTCAFCGKKEVQAKSFKRCARCKIEKFVQQRYYCSRSCQLEDWEESHRDEHSRKAEQL
ncbi:hypothetical protein HNY73_012034 [Argiope bruennichi]|uniref:MYND-type domain-containing protein n=1 Tax=Argiope bruennichi TaxID=94029 RepID=A0A8T0EYE7_ARGBR|nr:hypothetical protein HNY73_012034 [Argiope bruennichi]